MFTRGCRWIPAGTGTSLLVLPTSPSVSSCLLFASDPGFLFRVLGWHQACMLDERGDSLEVFPQAVHLPPGHQHQPVVPDHHPASGTRTNLISIRLAVRLRLLLISLILSRSFTSSKSPTWTVQWTASDSACLPL